LRSETDGRYYCFVELDRGPDGKRRRKKISGGTHDQVVEKRDKVTAELAKGVTPASERITVATAMTRWIDEMRDLGEPEASTVDNDESIATNRITRSSLGRRPTRS
jgi:integrase